MEVKIVKRMVTIQGDNCQEYNEKYNSFMDSIGDATITKEHISQFREYSIDIFYETKVKICETAEDEYLIQGIKYYCNDCPHLERIADGRAKLMPCPYHELGRVNINKPACERFYQELKAGQIKPMWE